MTESIAEYSVLNIPPSWAPSATARSTRKASATLKVEYNRVSIISRALLYRISFLACIQVIVEFRCNLFYTTGIPGSYTRCMIAYFKHEHSITGINPVMHSEIISAPREREFELQEELELFADGDLCSVRN